MKIHVHGTIRGNIDTVIDLSHLTDDEKSEIRNLSNRELRRFMADEIIDVHEDSQVDDIDCDFAEIIESPPVDREGDGR